MLNNARISLGASSYTEVNDRLNALKNEKENLKKNNEALSNKLASLEANKLLDEIKVIDGIARLNVYLPGASRDNIFGLLDSIKAKYQDHLFVFIGEVNLPVVVSVSGKAKEKYNAGLIVKKVAGVLGGSGGGRPDIASGAGKDASKVKEALGAIDE